MKTADKRPHPLLIRWKKAILQLLRLMNYYYINYMPSMFHYPAISFIYHAAHRPALTLQAPLPKVLNLVPRSNRIFSMCQSMQRTIEGLPGHLKSIVGIKKSLVDHLFLSINNDAHHGQRSLQNSGEGHNANDSDVGTFPLRSTYGKRILKV